MSPQELETLAPLIGFAICAFIISIPVVAFSARFAVKPVVDALIRLREAQGKMNSSNEMLVLQDRRLSLLESEMQHIGTALERLAEAQEFQARLGAPLSVALPTARPAPAGAAPE
ncbi:hypothetical protein [Longimicrobium sp.]|uniref:hypothetical protein n=1 Tax=Longimicrobium sp. TaxID=2029185 RepID=UPI002D14066C|nr:hypothetical protein [Longimicrobium sp.]HSU18061.1 hypothetical protein [Longimicrobium sp.]